MLLELVNYHIIYYNQTNYCLISGHSYHVRKGKQTLPDVIILNQNNPNFLIDQNNDEHQEFVPWYLTCTSSLCIGRAYYKVLVNSD